MRSRFREIEVFHEGQGQHYQVLLRNQGRTESLFRFGHYKMTDKFIESSFSVVVGVDSRLWWAEESVGGEEETVSIYAASLIEKKKRKTEGVGEDAVRKN